MEATASSAFQFHSWISCGRIGGKQNLEIEFNKKCKVEGIILPNYFGDLQNNRVSLLQRRSSSRVSKTCSNSRGYICASFDRNGSLKTKGQEVCSCLNGSSVFLLGMMGSGKTTVGKILSESLNYAFVDSDEYVEQLVNGISVTRIFQQYGENFFRNMESKALKKLSQMPQHVVATGGGAVICPMNWKYMKGGITVFLDVPVDALARRIAAVGTDSRPLLNFDSGDPYTKTFMGLSTLWRKRGEAYSDADVTLSIIDLAKKLNLDDVSDLAPATIALEVLVQVQNYFQANACKTMPNDSDVLSSFI